jgi:hypothetical protein
MLPMHYRVTVRGIYCPDGLVVLPLSAPAMNRKAIYGPGHLAPRGGGCPRRLLSSYMSNLRMEIADTDSWQFRQNLKREEALLKKLMEQLDAELAVPEPAL